MLGVVGTPTAAAELSARCSAGNFPRVTRESYGPRSQTADNRRCGDAVPR